jgi:hypothetical protein
LAQKGSSTIKTKAAQKEKPKMLDNKYVQIGLVAVAAIYLYHNGHLNFIIGKNNPSKAGKE